LWVSFKAWSCRDGRYLNRGPCCITVTTVRKTSSPSPLAISFANSCTDNDRFWRVESQ
jgi:hypothetical protein